ncbi:MAG TPA: EFR1 family ferrodoxin [Clostridiaceae bacterium]
MKAAVYYFTGTGNSLIVAKDIGSEIEGELISIPYVIGKGTIKTNAKIVVIVFPVYMWGIPLIIDRFIRSFEDLKDKYVYAIATNGGMPGVTINILEKVIEDCKGKLAAGFTVNMPGNYVPKYGAFTEEKQKELFDKWSKKVKIIAEYIKANKQGKKENNSRLKNLIFSNLIYNNSAKNISRMDKNFWIDEKCNKCGICQKICPVCNIDINNGNPVWKGKCEQCFACLQWCPQKAIQYGKKTTMRKRYHHPNVNISDILNQVNNLIVTK